MKNNLKDLQKKIKIKFKNILNLKKAITHKSYDPLNNYEKLEFLGDRILGFVISKKLIELYPNQKEGALDKKLASLVNKKKCLEISKKINLQNFIRTGSSKKKKIVIEDKIVSDSCESLIGAIYLDQDFEIVENFILKLWKVFLEKSAKLQIDSKTKLQEYSLKKFKSLPVYKLLNSTGPHHKPSFKIAVKLQNTKYINATGNSKKDAEQNAAALLLKKIGI